MKTLIIYASQTGVTEDCAKNISKMLKGESITVNINKSNGIIINNYDNIILGSSLRAGLINKKLKKWLIKNENILMSKKVSFFICGLSNDKEAIGSLDNALTPDLRDHIKIKSLLGGEVRFEKLNFFYRFIMKQILKTRQVDLKIDQNKLIKFVDDINK